MKNSPKNFYNVVDKKKLGINEAIAVAGEVEQLQSDVSGIETTLGNADSGLIKQVNDLQTTVDNIDYDISRKADIDGTYPDLTAGHAQNAEQLDSTVMIEDRDPYIFRTSGGSKDIGNREHDQLVGGSIVWNQLVNTTDTSITVNSGHYLVTFISGSWDIIQSDGNAITVDGSTDMIFDITKMFGSSVANAIYTMETRTAGNGVSYFRNLFPKIDYGYDAGTIMSVRTSAHIMVGFNQWDEEWELGSYDASGQPSYSANTIRTKNYIDVFPNTTYFIKSNNNDCVMYFYDINKEYISVMTRKDTTFTTPSNARYVRFRLGSSYGTKYNNDICINFSWSGYRNGEYEPYVKHINDLDPDLELHGIAKVDDNGNIYYDGDTYSSDGTVIRNYEIRAYASGDESLPNAITDGTNTVVKLDTPVEESADPFHDPQWVDDFGTEEYVDIRSVPVPVGHNTSYPANLRDKIQHLPEPTGVNGTYLIREENEKMTLVPDQIPSYPTTDGTYVLTCTVSDGAATVEWIANT